MQFVSGQALRRARLSTLMLIPPCVCCWGFSKEREVSAWLGLFSTGIWSSISCVAGVAVVVVSRSYGESAGQEMDSPCCAHTKHAASRSQDIWRVLFRRPLPCTWRAKTLPLPSRYPLVAHTHTHMHTHTHTNTHTHTHTHPHPAAWAGARRRRRARGAKRSRRQQRRQQRRRRKLSRRLRRRLRLPSQRQRQRQRQNQSQLRNQRPSPRPRRRSPPPSARVLHAFR